MGQLIRGSPRLFCRANSLPPNTQSEGQVLRMPPATFTLGPEFDGIRAERQMGAGGFLKWISGRKLDQVPHNYPFLPLPVGPEAG